MIIDYTTVTIKNGCIWKYGYGWNIIKKNFNNICLPILKIRISKTVKLLLFFYLNHNETETKNNYAKPLLNINHRLKCIDLTYQGKFYLGGLFQT